MSLAFGDAGIVYPHTNGKNLAGKAQHQNVPIDALIDLRTAQFQELGFVNRNGSVEGFKLGEIVTDSELVHTVTASGITLPSVGSRCVAVTAMPEGLFSAPRFKYQEMKTGEQSSGIFIRNGIPIGDSRGTTTRTMVSGSCLFGSAGLVGIFADGSEISLSEPGVQINAPLEGIRVDTGFSLYEVEGIERQAAIIRELHRLDPELNRLTFQIPREEYMLYCLGAKISGFLSPEIYEQICVAIQHRGESQERYLRSILPESISLEILRPLAPVHELVRCGEFADEDSACKAIYGELCAANSEHSRLFKAFKKVKVLPHIGLRGYPLGYVHGMASDTSGKILAIETFTEERIGEALRDGDVQKVLRSRGHSLESIYSLEGLIPVAGTTQLSRYVGSPSGLGVLGAPVPSQTLERAVPKAGPLFFTGIQASEAIVKAIKAMYSSIGRGV